MPQEIVYLDCNATAPVRLEVTEAVAHVLAEEGNPSSVHQAGRRARGHLDGARTEVAGLVGVKPSNVIFTSGGSEANATALTRSGAKHLIISAIEHDSVLETARMSGLKYDVIPVDGEGRVDLVTLEDSLKSVVAPALLSLMLANNETGVIQPVAEVAALAQRYGVQIHCDAVQAAGKIATDFNDLGVDYLSLSAHKIGGPMGVGALILRDSSPLTPLIRGGGQEQGRRAGTENLPGIVGFGVAAALAKSGLRDFARLAGFRDHLESRVKAQAPEAILFGSGAQRLPNTSCLSMPGVGSDIQLIDFDLAGICVSSGAACSSGRVRASHVLEAMGVDARASGEVIRVSLGWSTTHQEVDRFIEAWTLLYDRNGKKLESSAA